jgi:nucleotide-binding universal stress UspA family protein
MIKTVLVAVDGSDHAEKALDLAADLAAKYRARLVLLHVLMRDATPRQLSKLARPRELTPEQRKELKRFAEEPAFVAPVTGIGGAYIPLPPPVDLLEPIGRQVLERAAETARKAGVKRVETALDGGDPATAILDRAKREKVDMIVLGSRGFGDLKGLLLGSVSHKVASHAHCTCITVK